MAHAAHNLEVKPLNAYAGDGTANMFHKGYLITTDAPAVVEAADYLNASAKRLPKGTRIEAVMSLGTTPVIKDYVVTANTGTAVTIAEYDVTDPG